MPTHFSRLSVPDGEEQLISCFCSLGVSDRLLWSKIGSANILRSLATNIIVSSMLVLGGSATVTDLTGMNTIAVCAHYLTLFAYPESSAGLFPDSSWRSYLCRRWRYAIYVIMRLVRQLHRTMSPANCALQHAHDHFACDYPRMLCRSLPLHLLTLL